MIVVSYFDALFSSVQILGFSSLLVLCLSRHSRISRWTELGFVAQLIVVALSAIWALNESDPQWVFACPTLATMVVGATVDFRGHRRRVDF